MSTPTTEADIKKQAGTFRMTPEEKEEIDRADAEAEEDLLAGRFVTVEEFLAELRRS
jgi:hypothetical protein